VVPHNIPAINVVAEPSKINQSCEHTLQIDVIAKDEPETVHSLSKQDDHHKDHPGKHQTSDIFLDSKNQEARKDQKEGEEDDEGEDEGDEEEGEEEAEGDE